MFIPVIKDGPVPLKDKQTLGMFENALKKVHLLYDNIERNKKFQMALLSSKVKGSGYLLMYTSSIDKRVHSKILQYPRVKFADHMEKPYGSMGFRPGTLVTLTSIFDDRDTLKGLLDYTGEEIVKPNFKYLTDFHHYFLYCEKSKREHPELRYNKAEVWDYDRNLRLIVEDGIKVDETQNIQGHRINYVIEHGPGIIAKRNEKSKWYMLHDDQVYTFIKYDRYIGKKEIGFNFNQYCFTLGEVGTSVGVELNYKEMMAKTHRFVLGDRPIFERIKREELVDLSK